MPSSTYPSRTEIEELCSHLATDNQAHFFDRVSPNVEWDVLGKETTERPLLPLQKLPSAGQPYRLGTLTPST